MQLFFLARSRLAMAEVEAITPTAIRTRAIDFMNILSVVEKNGLWEFERLSKPD
jgi:hypothetical protein